MQNLIKLFLIVILTSFSFASVKKVEKDSWYKPSIDTTWHWQLSGKINMNKDADLYIVDLYDTDTEDVRRLHKKGKKVIAYFSAGSYEKWRPNAMQFQKCEVGYKMDGWNERWVDIRTNNIQSIAIERLELAKKKGFDGVEADNVDGYINNTGFNLSFEDQLKYNKFLANEAHKRGLAIALKNDLDQIVELEPYFDFHINEECHKYNECDKLLPFIKAGKPVFNAEYEMKNQNTICKKSKQLGLQTIILPLELDDSYSNICK